MGRGKGAKFWEQFENRQKLTFCVSERIVRRAITNQKM